MRASVEFFWISYPPPLTSSLLNIALLSPAFPPTLGMQIFSRSLRMNFFFLCKANGAGAAWELAVSPEMSGAGWSPGALVAGRGVCSEWWASPSWSAEDHNQFFSFWSIALTYFSCYFIPLGTKYNQHMDLIDKDKGPWTIVNCQNCGQTTALISAITKMSQAACSCTSKGTVTLFNWQCLLAVERRYLKHKSFLRRPAKCLAFPGENKSLF